ncbi:hypothetical protein E2P81_ATG05921 [Venturia nashicola]|nr:hypothetical protein E2P81_ATG05921 [Venturia nashicola]
MIFEATRTIVLTILALKDGGSSQLTGYVSQRLYSDCVASLPGLSSILRLCLPLVFICVFAVCMQVSTQYRSKAAQRRLDAFSASRLQGPRFGA